MSEPEGRGAPEASGEYSMSGQAPAGERPGGGQTSVRDCLHAEWTKVRTAPGTIWLLAAAMVLTVGVSTGAAAATRCPSGAGCPVDVTKLSLTGVQVGQTLVAILAVLMVSAEYGTGNTA